jgi:hypothetical protein
LVALAVALAVVYVVVDFALDRPSSNSATLASTASNVGSLTIVTLADGQLAPNAVYRISPDPFTGGGNYTIHDGDVGRDASSTGGIITIEGMSDGTFSVIQVTGPDGKPREIIPRIVTIDNSSSESVTFGAIPAAGSGNESSATIENIESVIYAAKFECGTIRGDEGPLRPGHYDTDIGIFNKQGFPVGITWSAAAHENEASNALLKTLASQTSTSIVCDDIGKVLGAGEGFVEGFVLIEVPLDPRLRSSISGASSVLLGSSQDTIDVLDVQTFYTANALEELPHSVLVDKISFVIHGNTTIGGIPDSMIDKILDVTIPSTIGDVSQTEERVRSYLARQYNMTVQQAEGIVIEIKSIDVGVGTMIDDHAISLSKVRPQAIYTRS